ncbi:hypothetical protein [Polaromonas sp. P5_D5]
MSFLNWFSDKPQQASAAANDEQKRASVGRDKFATSVPQRLSPEHPAPADSGKLKRHARREQLYVAIREAMTRSGVLSASYKFKVLSLDQSGNEFLVMMDLAKAFGGTSEQLSGIEASITQHAKARFEITVPAVYWRLEEMAVVVKQAPTPPQAVQAPVVPAPVVHAPVVAHAEANVETRAPAPVKPATPRYEPIQADEVAAFKQALVAASAQGPAVAPEKGVKVQSGPRSRSYTLLTGFEDTEMPPEFSTSPALSSTQYGDLN